MSQSGQHNLVYEAGSGKVVAATLRARGASFYKMEYREHPKYGWIWVEGEHIPTLEMTKAVPFSYELLGLVAERILDGVPITKICRKPDMPSYAQLCAWKRSVPGVADILDRARLDRAEALRDEALAAAEDADEDNVASQRLKVDTYKWAAGVEDRRYTASTKVEATVSVPTQIVVQTGIDRGVDTSRAVGDTATEVDNARQISTQDEDSNNW